MSDASIDRWEPRTLTALSTDRKTLEEVTEQARQSGYADGLAQGQAEAKKQGEQTASDLSALWQSMQKPIANQDSEVSEHLLALVIALTRSLLRKELTTDSELIKSTLDEALQALAECEAPISITFSPDDKALIESLLDEKRITAELIADPNMLRGGCRIERGQALVDATLEARIQLLVDQLAANGSAPVQDEEQSPRAALDPDRISDIAKRFTSDKTND